ncbi:MAG: DNA-3-methyladenine glycosylase 2 family protein [Clostridia bacterium]|nr:DNA-3-methyladenine glycosylase 2 family protein [Oscillospiraceae bacterium]MBQ6702455.1 DNA-3-methyladenine glycosylase 2 family protein [Clostridia bacterium]
MFKLTEKDGKLYVTDLNRFSVNKIFDCGQCFRFDPVENGVEGVAFGKFLRFEQPNESTVTIDGITKKEFEETFCRYLALDCDYAEVDSDILTNLKNDETIQKAIQYGSGIRILRQDGWEALCSFIVSQNNNIPRIKKIIEAMSREFGQQIDDRHYAFPTAEALANAGVDKIFALKTGFRAKYIHDAATKVASGEIDLSKVDKMTTKEATEYLMQIKGVGLKVASCALLFGFDKTDAFPVDVWVKRVLEKYYPNGLDIDNLGSYGGMIQQYLFYYERYNAGSTK